MWWWRKRRDVLRHHGEQDDVLQAKLEMPLSRLCMLKFGHRSECGEKPKKENM
jgi:hypothetical protein